MGPTFAEQSNAAFRQIVFIIATVLGLLGWLFFVIYQKVYLYAGVLIHKIKTACACASLAQLAAMHPLIFAGLGVLSLTVAGFLFYAVYQLVKLAVQTRKFTAQHLISAQAFHSAKLRRAILALNLDPGRIIEIRKSTPAAFCFGWWRPKVCVSSGLVKIMRPDELSAVLAHEHHHLISREPLKLFIVKCWQNIFGWLPGIKTGVRRYLALAEIAADEQATGNFSDRSKLARALFKITATEEKQLLRAGLALSFFSSVIAERVQRLADDGYAPGFRILGKEFLLGAGFVILGLAATFVFLADSSQALAMHNNGSCGAPSGANQSTALICGADNYRPRAVAACGAH